MTDWKHCGYGECNTCSKHADLDQNAVCEKCDEDALYEHLTPAQEEKIDEQAFELMLEACQDYQYLFDCLKHYVSIMTVEQKIDSISSDEECVIEHLGFDPKTGDVVDED